MYFIALAVIILIYASTLLIFYFGWKRIVPFKNPDPQTSIFVTIIIPARNEQDNIGNLLNDLLVQNYNANYFEILVLDDHSTDKTFEILKKFKDQQLIRYFLLPVYLQGKKAAIRRGVELSKGELIVTVDADCRVGENWLATIASFYNAYSPKLIVGPVLFEKSQNIGGKLSEMEFMSLVASGAGALGVGVPIMCNGANLAFEKATYLNVYDEMNIDLASGDDMFLLQAIKKRWKDSVLFIKSQQALVLTRNLLDFKSFLQQRKRWASKATRYTDKSIISVAIIIGAFNVFLVLLLILSLLGYLHFSIFLYVILIKCFVDFPLLYSFSKFFGKARLMQYFWLAQLLYPFYMVFMIFYAKLGSYQWKNRKFKNII